MVFNLVALILAVLCAVQAFHVNRLVPGTRIQKHYMSTETINPAEETVESDQIIVLTDKARSHLTDLREKQKLDTLHVRMGVRSGGCSGMSYIMDIVKPEEVGADDHIEEYEGIKCVIDPKSLLFIYGMMLDYSDELIGGGFQFSNPNAETSCGCGKSFGI